MILAAGVSTGVGISKARLFNKRRNEVRSSITGSIENEIAKVDYCVRSANYEIKKLSNFLVSYRNDSVVNVLDKYIDIINNDYLIEEIKDTIKEKRVSAEYAITYIMDSSRKVIEGLDDEYLNEKVQDIEEIKCRLLDKLMGESQVQFKNIKEECIVVSDDLTPGDVLNMNPLFIKGIVTFCGGPTSSSSIVARRMNIPAVTGVGHEGRLIKNGDILIVDGNIGKIIINPNYSELTTYKE